MTTPSSDRSSAAFALLAAACLLAPVARAAADADKPVTDQEVRAVVDGHVAELKACMKEHGAATGKVIVEFSIERDGRVRESKVGHASSNGALDQCIAAGFRRWTFPKPRDGKPWLTAYPIIFSVPKEPVKGTLTEDEIVKTVQGHMGEVQACLIEAVKEKPGVSGIAELGIAVSPAGKVVDVKVLKSSTGAPKLDACIVGRAKTWAFPKPKGGGEAAFRYPFKLNLKPEPKPEPKPEQSN